MVQIMHSTSGRKDSVMISCELCCSACCKKKTAKEHGGVVTPNQSAVTLMQCVFTHGVERWLPEVLSFSTGLLASSEQLESVGVVSLILVEGS